MESTESASSFPGGGLRQGAASGSRRPTLRAGAALVWAMSAVAGSGSSDPLELSPDPADFGTVAVGDVSDLTITAENDTSLAVVIDEVRLDPAHDALSVVDDTCTSTELPAGGSCTVSVRFEPVIESFIVTELVVTTNRGSAALPVSASSEFVAEATAPSGTESDNDGAEPPGTEPTAGDDSPAGPPVEGTEPPGGQAPPLESIVPADTVPPGVTPAEPDIEVCEQRVRQLGLSASFVPAVTMAEGATETVGLSLAISGTPLDSPPGAGTSPTTIVTFESDGCVITAQLVGNGFEISPAGLIEQSFISEDHLEWSWQVTPIRSGNLELQAQITPWVVDQNGTRQPGGASTYYADIEVTSKPRPERSLGYRVNEVVASPVGATVVGVLFAGVSATGFVSAAKKRRKGNGSSREL